MSFNRIHMFLMGVGVIIIFVLINRYNIISNSVMTTGTVVSFEYKSKSEYESKPKFLYPIIEFRAKGMLVRFDGPAEYNYQLGDELQILYDKNDFHKVYIYSVMEFWAKGFLWGLFPLMLLVAYVFSYLSPNQRFTISLRKGLKLR